MKEINVVVLLDKSGSMSSVLKDTIGGFNTFLKAQKEQKEARIKFSLTLFDTVSIDDIYTDVDINEVQELNDKNYCPRGATPLWDAIGMTINKLAKKKDLLLVIITDGYENSSTEYTTEAVKKMIAEQEKQGWKFLYLGADVKNFDDAHSIGINKSFAYNSVNTRGAYASLSNTVKLYAMSGEVNYETDDKQPGD